MPQELQQLRPGDAFAGRYRVVRLIRAGGMGAVYEVEDQSTRRRRALKIMHPSLVQSQDSRARFQREVFIGAELETEHVVEVIDAGVDPQSQVPFLTMELLRGEELGDRLERVGRMAPNEVVEVLAQIGRALDKAHARGIVHRDLKPENVYLTQREDGSMRAKILDFGIAKLLEGHATNATQAAGTPLYMAPEQTDKLGHVSPATDIWAIGLVAYRMLVGFSYWQGESMQQLYRQILIDPITSAVERARNHGVELPPGFDHWFMRCVARRPEDRWSSAGQTVTELAIGYGISISRGPSGGGYAMTPPPYPTPLQQQLHVTPAPNITPHNATPAPGPSATLYSPAQPVDPRISYPNHNLEGPSYAGPPRSDLGHVDATAGTQASYSQPQGPPPQTERASISGTQLAGAPLQVPFQPGAVAPRPSGGFPVAAIVALVLVLGGAGAFAAFKFLGDSKPTSTSTSTPKGDDDDPSPTHITKPPKPAPSPSPSPSVAEAATSWTDGVVASNPFLGVGKSDLSLQQHEVTRGEYGAFYEAGGSDGKKLRLPLDAPTLPPPSSDRNEPITWITWEQAKGFCEAIGARLPTAAEWDRAVKGDDARKYPWGNEWPLPMSEKGRDLAAGKPGASPVEVGSSATDKGPYGHLDLGGNVQEWTSTDGPTGHKLLRGSDISHGADVFASPDALMTATAAGASPDKTAISADAVGFRCAKSPN